MAMFESQQLGTAGATLQLLRGYSADPTYSALATKRREYLRSLDTEKLLGSDIPQVARLPDMALSTSGVTSEQYIQMLLRPSVVKRHLQPTGKLQRFLNAGPPPVLAMGTGLVRRLDTRRAAPSTVALDNVLYFTGCAGTGKSHVLRELAARAIHNSTNVRVVYIADCQAWAALEDWAQVSYLAAAISLGFGADDEFNAKVFQALSSAEMTDPGMLALQLLNSVNSFCKAREDENGRLLRVLFCVDGYSGQIPVISNIVQAIAQRSDVFFLALATTANEYIPAFSNAAARIPPQYKEDEVQAILAHYMTESFDAIARERLAEKESLVRHLVYQNTAFHPGDMALLFERAAGATDFTDFSKRIRGFTTDYSGLDNETLLGSGLDRTCLRPVLSESAHQFAEAVFRLFFKLPTDQGSGDVKGLEKCGVQAEYNAHFQMFSADERGQGSPSELEFVSPRRANYVFDQVSKDACVFTTVSKRLGLGGRGRYEMAFACLLWMLRREGMDFLESRGTYDHRLFGAAPKTREDIRLDSLRPFAHGVSTVGYYSAANSASACGPMRGLDFVTFQRREQNGLASFVLATGCEPFDIDHIMENCAYWVRPEDSVMSTLSPEECAIAGISEACRVAQHMGRPLSTVYLVASEQACRNASRKSTALPGTLAPQLKLVSIKTVLRKSSLLPVNKLPQFN
ncbi:hypothetical protein GGI03_000577 [Coemansia sp. RSA 2337]|nr:hypothetical protein LPJ71_000990 [Coemansia sp. S17]KAJ2020251.1 hypothetical protein GGI14_000987 [Coemansia sp. S680]KAJ2103188.1 hypothetical protein GGI16_003038 [Coemansia sp. S142-1]KAJ2469114.1 hypothetical protein GGI03_000577 [Coemansia sp. RSA 2337]